MFRVLILLLTLLILVPVRAGFVTMAACYAACAVGSGIAGVEGVGPVACAAYAACQHACTGTLLAPTP
jgi:hypothetical protein